MILPLFWYLLRRLSNNNTITNAATLLVATTPTLIGFSRIINPDALLWGFATLSILAFCNALIINRRKFYFAIFAGLTLGLALLSKYTAAILWLLFAFIFTIHGLLTHKSWRSVCINYTQILIILTSVALVIFTILMPQTLFNPKHFLEGTFYAPTLRPIVDALISITHTQQYIFLIKSLN